jgi:hypothetical protein
MLTIKTLIISGTVRLLNYESFIIEKTPEEQNEEVNIKNPALLTLPFSEKKIRHNSYDDKANNNSKE